MEAKTGLTDKTTHGKALLPAPPSHQLEATHSGNMTCH